ncbi:Esterase/lipase/thioesterase family active site [Nitrosomonas nitrosa]|uniref:Esterase/lipase/thioesterase family active site n=1 Tax=Nitrosomonas nitrosa TaxID=52442 RepID=A0A1I4QJN6_9PROT|nr:hydrolase 1, exosortase A system-associated [Nitrosomonas nitrosa]CAE6511890.1 Esterase/lipase/thioesterase family active site [Nitrosomonas nitrosa]SFM39880.1 exosortase A system-associated hydrolase 1 [Nitrosomonas nitrosa]
MIYHEQAIRFECADDSLFGILSIPDQPISRGVLIVVGGPQYRVGSHRQFTLLARHLATAGIPAMRYDYRGMGDSEGEIRTFENIHDDLHSAIDQFFLALPHLKELAIWGLCDAASAALFYAYQDPRIVGLILLNPWVRTEQSAIKTYIKHYYATRLFQPDFWKKVGSGRYNPKVTLRFLLQSLFTLTRKGRNEIPSNDSLHSDANHAPLPERMLAGLNRFTGKVFIITSGDDLTAKEFLDLINQSRDWDKALKIKKAECIHLQDANHTFSSSKWRNQVATLTENWVKSW